MTRRQRFTVALHIALIAVLLLAATWLAVHWVSNPTFSREAGAVEAHRLIAVAAAFCCAASALVGWGIVAWRRTGRRRFTIGVDVLTLIVASYALLLLVFVHVALLLAILALCAASAVAILLVPRPPARDTISQRFMFLGGVLAILVAALAVPLTLAFYPLQGGSVIWLR